MVEVPADADRAFRGGGNPQNVIDAVEIESAASLGMSLMSLLREQVPGIRFRGGNCIEYRFATGWGGATASSR